MKRCPRCGVTKDTSDFYKNRSNASGLDTRCKDCRKASVKKRYDENPERVKEYIRRWEQENAEHVKARRAKYRAEHKADMVRYREENREAIAEQARAWRAANVERQRLHSATRKARKLNLAAQVVSAKDLRRLLASPCAVTGCANTDIHIDHIIPLSRGGAHSIGNLQALCAFHNMSKHSKLWIEFLVHMKRRTGAAA